MELVRELEASTRGPYCGAIGYFAPDGSASFNVAIRTVTICGDHGELGIGSAVVYDSTPQTEYAECLLKARYFEAVRSPLQLIETLRWSPVEGFTRLQYHLARIAASAAAFGIAFHAEDAKQMLQEAVGNADAAMRARLVLSEDGRLECTIDPLTDVSSSWRYLISPVRVLSTDVLLRHKTNGRELFEAQYAEAVGQGYDEVVFLNETGSFTEGSRSNLFACVNGRLVTPPVACGLLNGCLRQELIDTGQCTERTLLPSDLDIAEAVYLGNSVRGLIPTCANTSTRRT